MNALPRRAIGAFAAALLLFAATVLPPISGASAEGDLVICLDPGHSQNAGGASVTITEGRGRNATTHTLEEWQINVDVALSVAADLRARFAADPVRVILTWGADDGLSRTWDWDAGPALDGREDVVARGSFCEDNGASVVVSLHTNGINVPFNGTLTAYRDDNDLALAGPAHDLIYNELRLAPSGKKIGGFRNFGLDQADWWISLGAPSSAVAIFEPVVMTNDAEALRLLPTISEAPAGRRAQIAAIEAEAIAVYVRGLLP